VSYTVPSRCADDLKSGAADIGIIPAAAYATVPDLVIVPDVAIASKNAVRSILLISKLPLEKIRSVAVDDSSRTSAALVEIFLKKFVGIDPGFSRHNPNLESMLQWHDAGLLIGDPALLANTKRLYVYDLAEQWRHWTGRPFVFAFWAVRKAALAMAAPELNIARVFQESRDNGVRQISQIASAWNGKLRLPEDLIREYLTQNIDYGLDQENLDGLRLFYRYAAECGALPHAPELEFLEMPRLTARI
jgi:chorismate dehydratase